MLTPDLQSLPSQIEFQSPSTARACLVDIAGDTAEMLAFSRLSEDLLQYLRESPDPDRALNNLERFIQARGGRIQLFQRFESDPAAFAHLIEVLASSQYLADILVRNPEYFEFVADSSLLGRVPCVDDLLQEMEASCSGFRTFEHRLDAIRRFRRREILRIAAADLLGLLKYYDVVRQLSILAEAVIEQCWRVVRDPHPTPPPIRGREKGGGADMCILALGKLGGRELNYSSDIDLMFIASSSEEAAALVHSAQLLTRSLGEMTAEGFLYRVDLRLRPFAGAGPLVMSLEAFTNYLQDAAEPAERQAMLKARPIGGNAALGERLLEEIEPLLLLDSTRARSQVRQLKMRIEEQLSSRRRSDHVKLAPGGIRDIEFIAQALQLESGCRTLRVRTPNTLDTLSSLVREELISAEHADSLTEAHVFLRTVEHRMQLMNNQQTHQLPKTNTARRYLARLMGFSGTSAATDFEAAYQSRTQAVRRIFDEVLPPAAE